MSLTSCHQGIPSKTLFQQRRCAHKEEQFFNKGLCPLVSSRLCNTKCRSEILVERTSRRRDGGYKHAMFVKRLVSNIKESVPL